MQSSVLLVEDDAEQSRIFTIFLKSKGLNVIAFSNPLEALENFRANVDLYTIVLTDFRMVCMSGIEFAREIRKLRGNSIFIIMITGYSIQNFIDEKEVANLIDRVMMKPFSLKNLDTILSYYLEHIG